MTARAKSAPDPIHSSCLSHWEQRFRIPPYFGPRYFGGWNAKTIVDQPTVSVIALRKRAISGCEAPHECPVCRKHRARFHAALDTGSDCVAVGIPRPQRDPGVLPRRLEPGLRRSTRTL